MAVFGVECCPFLGLRDDSSYNLYPSENACCLVLSRPKAISVEHQEEFCLARNYTLCPRLTRFAERGRVRGALPSYLPLWTMVVLIFLTVGAAWGILGLIDRLGREAPAGPARLSNVEWQRGTRVDEGDVPAVQPAGQLAIQRAGAGTAAPATPPPAVPTAPVGRSTPTASPTRRAEYYVVRPGETLNSIARAYGVTVDALRQANGMQREDLLLSGARLVVPVSRTIYIVEAGDTLTGIGRRFGVTVEELATANELPQDALLPIGQQLVVPSR